MRVIGARKAVIKLMTYWFCHEGNISSYSVNIANVHAKSIAYSLGAKLTKSGMSKVGAGTIP